MYGIKSGKIWKKGGNMNYVSANNEYHVPLHVKPILLKKGGVTDAKVVVFWK